MKRVASCKDRVSSVRRSANDRCAAVSITPAL